MAISLLYAGPAVRTENCIKPSNYRYEVITGNAALALTLDEVKSYLRLPASETDEDSFLIRLINAAVSCFESYTRRVLFRKTFKTYRDAFTSRQFVLRKSDFVTLDDFQYLTSGVLTDVDNGVYQIVNTQPFARVILKDQQCWPSNIDIQKEAIEMTFTAGLADVSDVYPDDIAIALLQLVAFWYENRGDCCMSLDNVGKLPQGAVGVFNKYKITYITAENYQESSTNDFVL